MIDAAERLYERLLVIRCQTGDPAGLSELIERYGRPLRFFLKKMAGEASADDLLQDVWIDVFAKVGRLRDPQAFAAWVYRIARDKAYAQRSRRKFVDAPLPEDVVDQAIEPAWNFDDLDQLRAVLNQIDLEHREVLLLRFVENMSYEQIAMVIDRPVGTVRSRLHYAKVSLREAMDHPSRREDPS